MRKIYFILAITVGVMFTSCGSNSGITVPPPVATNTISSVSFSDLNLEREDYKILNTIESEAIVTVGMNDKGQWVISDDAGFSMTKITELDKKTGQTYTRYETVGAIRAGFLSQDYSTIDYTNAESIARALAIDRLINLSKELGGDAVIDPIISTNVETTVEKVRVGFTTTDVPTTTYKTIASAKVVVIKSDK